MIDSSRFGEKNIVHSLVIYEWGREINFSVGMSILQVVLEYVGSNPDFLTLYSNDTFKTYRYKNFLRKSVLDKEWTGGSFCWWRREGVLSEDSIRVSFDTRASCFFSFHIDEYSIQNVGEIYNRVVDLFVKNLDPIYGIGYSMPFFWGPSTFAMGQGSSRFAASDRTFYGAPDEIQKRNFEFGRVFRKPIEQRQLDIKFRDVFEANLLSARHLAQHINNIPLADWIVLRNVGDLLRLSETTWIWKIPPEQIEATRKIMINNGLTIITS